MSLLIDSQTGDPIHTPKRRDVFEFDDEVASIFENMAIRSIPMYAEMHRMFAHYVADDIQSHSSELLKDTHYRYRILDVGASTGVFTKMLWNALGRGYHTFDPYIQITSLDVSQPMLDKIKETFQWMNCVRMDVNEYLSNHQKAQFRIVVASYTLQFVGSEAEQRYLLTRLAELVERGGCLLIGHKEATSEYCDFIQGFIQREYYQFRQDNGYTLEEIKAKTAALKNSMFPMTRRMMEGTLGASFRDVVPLTRWGPFSSYLCKR